MVGSVYQAGQTWDRLVSLLLIGSVAFLAYIGQDFVSFKPTVITKDKDNKRVVKVMWPWQSLERVLLVDEDDLSILADKTLNWNPDTNKYIIVTQDGPPYGAHDGRVDYGEFYDEDNAVSLAGKELTSRPEYLDRAQSSFDQIKNEAIPHLSEGS